MLFIFHFTEFCGISETVLDNLQRDGMAQEARCKVVVRLLPPWLTEDAFKELIGDWLEATDWFSYWKGKPRY